MENNMKKFNYEQLANYLLDSLLDIYEVGEVLKILIGGDFETELLLELGFKIDDINFIKQDKEMFDNDIALRESIKEFYNKGE
jgi:hypothetical protein